MNVKVNRSFLQMRANTSAWSTTEPRPAPPICLYEWVCQTATQDKLDQCLTGITQRFTFDPTKMRTTDIQHVSSRTLENTRFSCVFESWYEGSLSPAVTGGPCSVDMVCSAGREFVSLKKERAN